MVYEHEIPSLTRLYFGKSAQLKRKIEAVASDILSQQKYEEIVTPLLTYHQHESLDEKELIRFSDSQNHIITLRADSTIDVVRIITRRLGRSVVQNKWFYIQPVFRYPSHEQYQIGAECINESDLSVAINDSIKILDQLAQKPLLQISNINIPRLIAKKLGIELEVFKAANLEALLKLNLPWLSKLAYLQDIDAIDDVISEVDEELQTELEKIKSLVQKISYDNIVIAPLYYAKMNYYDHLFFRYIAGNKTLGTGGNYRYKDVDSTGFALYTDNIIEELIKE
ncbi:MAG: ATP phosphoribosyltransferase regulatory subunit [Sulfurospirillum sp.]|nr:MAG: ATP phosphoribosyltransferase regulatory subunit [Sulfurospirillum sp.]